MKGLPREKRLIENEVIFRDVNKNIKEFIKEDRGPKEKTQFYCECSRPKCIERITLTPREYEKLHKDERHFITIAGHEFTEVEKVISKKGAYQVVEKHFKPPKPEEINLALKAINTSSAARS